MNLIDDNKQENQEQPSEIMLLQDLINPITIDNIEVDVIMEDSISYESEVTEFPVETGFTISDHVINKQPEIKLDCIFTPTPVTWYELHKDKAATRLEDVRRELERIRNEKEPITVTTPDRIYENVVLVKIPITRTIKDGLTLRMTLEFKQIAIVSSNTAEVPAEYAEQETKIQAQTGKTETNGGTATTEEIGNGDGNTNYTEDTGTEPTAETARTSIAKSMKNALGW